MKGIYQMFKLITLLLVNATIWRIFVLMLALSVEKYWIYRKIIAKNQNNYNKFDFNSNKSQYIANNFDILAKCQQKLGANLVAVLPKLGPAFIKFGQFLASRSDLVGEEICNQLRSLQDKVAAIPDEQMIEIIHRENPNLLKVAKIDSLQAAGSVAQVYQATMNNGDKIAIKVLRPRIRKEFAENLALLDYLAKMIQKFFPKSKRLKLNEVINVLRHSSSVELDMNLEAAAAERLRKNCESHGNLLYVPQVFWEYSTASVLVMEWVKGKSLNEIITQPKVEYNAAKIAEKLALGFFAQAHEDGFFHADIHGGNIIVDEQNRVFLIDCGIVSFLPTRDRLAIARILHAFINGDYDKVADLHFQSGYIPANESKSLFTLACHSIAAPIMDKSSGDVSMSSLLRRLIIITSKFNMETQPQLLLLQKTMVTLEGTICSISPATNMWDIAKPWFKAWEARNLSCKAKLSLFGDELREIIANKMRNEVRSGSQNATGSSEGGKIQFRAAESFGNRGYQNQPEIYATLYKNSQKSKNSRRIGYVILAFLVGVLFLTGN